MKAAFLQALDLFGQAHGHAPIAASLHPADFVSLLAECLEDFPGVSQVDEFKPFTVHGVQVTRGDSGNDLGKVLLEGNPGKVMIVELK